MRSSNTRFFGDWNTGAAWRVLVRQGRRRAPTRVPRCGLRGAGGPVLTVSPSHHASVPRNPSGWL